MSTERAVGVPAGAAAVPVPPDELARLLDQHAGPEVELRSLCRSEYTTSFPLYELEATGRGGMVRWMIKDLAWSSLGADAQRAKLRADHDPAREVVVHRDLLGEVAGPPAFVAGRCDGEGAPAWLIVEHVQGRELYQWGAPEAWELAARWLGRFHQRWRGRGALPQRHRRHLGRARFGPRHADEVARRAGAPAGAGVGSDLDAVLAAWPAAARELSSVEPTLSHGECYASNVLVTDAGRVAVVDWETAALGSGWEDLAALVTGWSSEVREQLLEAYVDAAPPDAGSDPRRLLDAARLQLCLQWIGADPAWQPPPEHRTDWLVEAVEIVEGSPWAR